MHAEFLLMVHSFGIQCQHMNVAINALPTPVAPWYEHLSSSHKCYQLVMFSVLIAHLYNYQIQVKNW